MFNFISRWFKKKPKDKPKGSPYPLDQLGKINKYKNEQHEKAMKEKIVKDPSDAIRKAGW